MVSHVLSWSLIVSRDLTWSYVVSHGLPRSALRAPGGVPALAQRRAVGFAQWSLVDSCGLLWSPLDFRGFLCAPAGPCGFP